MLHRLIAVLFTQLALVGQEADSAAAITATGRSMSVALDGILGGAGAQAPGERTLFLLIDPGQSLVQAGFVDALRSALARNEARLKKTRIGVAGVGVRGSITLRPSPDRDAVVNAVAALLQGARDDIRNVYADMRVVGAALGRQSGDRELVLVSLQNGDAEDNLEGTVRELVAKKVTVRCIAGESYLADSYWSARPYAQRPPKTELYGGDAAFVELPWGFVFQGTTANEVAPSGYACYGINRLAAATGGRVHLYSSPDSSRHQCAVYGTCLFCSGDHSPTVDTYWRARLARLAPSTLDRETVFQRAAGDPWFRAMLKAWQAASRAGLIRSSPSVRMAGNRLAPQRARIRGVFFYGGSTGFARQAKKAIKAAADCERILVSFERDTKGLDATKGIARYRAMAQFTQLMLQLTKVNLTTFGGWCREIAPELAAKRPRAYEPPEVDPVARDRRTAGIGFTNYCLCHGVAPFDDVELPGGPGTRKELAALRTLADRFEQLYGHTPLGIAVHRSGVAGFFPTYPGVVSKLPRKRPKSSTDANPLTERGRPPRPGRTSGGTSGPKTGR